jgi:hypothetical protein
MWIGQVKLVLAAQLVGLGMEPPPAQPKAVRETKHATPAMTHWDVCPVTVTGTARDAAGKPIRGAAVRRQDRDLAVYVPQEDVTGSHSPSGRGWGRPVSHRAARHGTFSLGGSRRGQLPL